MSILTGPRREVRLILHDGVRQWVTPSEDGCTLFLADGREVAEADAIYLPPCNPSKIICGHVTYNSRRIEFNANPVNPSYFQKPTTALNSHRGKLYIPEDCQYLNYEGELAVQFGVPCKGASFQNNSFIAEEKRVGWS